MSGKYGLFHICGGIQWIRKTHFTNVLAMYYAAEKYGTYKKVAVEGN